jgi:ankyrin repeat protein
MLQLLEGHTDHANDRDRDGRTPLALAVLKAKRLKTVQLLLNHRIKAAGGGTLAGGGGGGALVAVSAKKNGGGGEDEEVEEEEGVRSVDPDLADKKGVTPLAHAVTLGRLDLIEVLLNASEAIVRRDKVGRSKGNR